MDKFEEYYDELPHPVNNSEKEMLADVWNHVLSEVRDSLAEKIRPDPPMDKQVVDWNEIEHTIDKLKHE